MAVSNISFTVYPYNLPFITLFKNKCIVFTYYVHKLYICISLIDNQNKKLCKKTPKLIY